MQSDYWLMLAAKPAFYIVLMFVAVMPITWLLYKMIPEGRIKTALFMKRDLLAESRARTELFEQRLRESKRADPSQEGPQP